MENEKITMALWLMRNKSSNRGTRKRPLLPSQMYIAYIHAALRLLWLVPDISGNNCCFASCSGWIFAAFLEERTLAFNMCGGAHAGDVTVPSALPLSLSGGCGKVTGCKGMALSFIKFIEFFTNGWTQFPSNFLIMQICKISNLDQFKTATAPNLPVKAVNAETLK